MAAKQSFWKIKIRWLMAFLLLSACVDRIYFDIPPAKSLTVIEGFISDDPGPYTVNVSNGLVLDMDSTARNPLRQAKIKLYDDEGNVEAFTETSPGEYKTGGVIRGKVGHGYHISVETPDGKIFESESDVLSPVGEVERIRYEFEARVIERYFGEVPADVFKIFVDSKAGTGNQNYVRWRYKGTYKVETYPQFHSIFLQTSAYADPLPCSGYIIVPALGGGRLEKVGDCTCCLCWGNIFDPVPQLSDAQLITDNQFNDVKVAEVPINSATFYEGFLIEIEQMSLSKTAFDFFKLIRTQKESASSLFQPPSGEIRGNLKPVNSSANVVGLFWATAVSKKSIFISRSDVPYPLPPIERRSDTCLTYPNSSTEKPDLWP